MALKKSDLKGLTAPLASDLAARGVAAEVLEAIRPGGAENPARDTHAELRFYGRLCALRATVERGGSAPDAVAAADRVILEALAGTPAHVTMGGDPVMVDGKPLSAYPKSAIACLAVHVRSLEIARILRYVEQLGTSDDPQATSLIERGLTEVLYQHRVCAWIACTPGAGLPFDEMAADPELPVEFRDLEAHAIVAICRAFDTVNWARLRALEPLLAPPDAENEGRPGASWSQFFAGLAGEHEKSEAVLRDRTFVAAFATAQLNASAHREASARAKERSAHGTTD